MITHHQRVIRIQATDSPNVIARRQVLPGVLTWEEYQHRRATWDRVRQCVGLDAEFYEGGELLLFPPEWLNRAEGLASKRVDTRSGAGKRWMGVDPAEGGDKSSWAVGDLLGVLLVDSLKTPDTTFVPSHTIALMREWNIPPEHVAFDRGGGGKEHADRLRLQGYPVTTVAFGEAVIPGPRRGVTPMRYRQEEREERYEYTNRRAQMYHEASLMFDPGRLDEAGKPVEGYALPARFTELRRQLAVMPKLTDQEGRYYMLPKQNRNQDSTLKTLTQLVGHSPDEADAFVLMVHRMLHKERRLVAGSR